MNTEQAEAFECNGEYTLAHDENAIDLGLEPMPDHEGYFRDPETEYIYVQNGQTLAFVAGSPAGFADYLRH